MKYLDDDDLEAWLFRAVDNERVGLCDVLRGIGEVERRELHLRRGKSSLFAYLKRFRFSDSAAQKRIDAVRLARDVPDVLKRIETGDLSLAQVGVIQRGIRLKMRTGNVEAKLKEELVSLVSASPGNEAEKIVADVLGFALPKRTVIREQDGGSVRIALTLTKENWQSLSRCRELLSHVEVYGEMSEVIGLVCQFYILKNDPNVSTAPETVAPQHLYGALTDKERRSILRRDKSCQWPTPEGGICGSKFRLEVDHIKPRCEGGTNEPSNLRVLCRNHNQFASPADRYGKTKPSAGPSG